MPPPVQDTPMFQELSLTKGGGVNETVCERRTLLPFTWGVNDTVCLPRKKTQSNALRSQEALKRGRRGGGPMTGTGLGKMKPGTEKQRGAVGGGVVIRGGRHLAGPRGTPELSRPLGVAPRPLQACVTSLGNSFPVKHGDGAVFPAPKAAEVVDNTC